MHVARIQEGSGPKLSWILATCMIWKSGSEIRRLKLTLFLCNLRVKSPAELEAILQDWPAGKDSGIWLSIEIDLKQCRDLSSEDFKCYMELGYGQDPVVRGFFVHEKRRKVVAIFIFDRSIAQGALASGGSRIDAPNIRLWMPAPRSRAPGSRA